MKNFNISFNKMAEKITLVFMFPLVLEIASRAIALPIMTGKRKTPPFPRHPRIKRPRFGDSSSAPPRRSGSMKKRNEKEAILPTFPLPPIACNPSRTRRTMGWGARIGILTARRRLPIRRGGNLDRLGVFLASLPTRECVRKIYANGSHPTPPRISFHANSPSPHSRVFPKHWKRWTSCSISCIVSTLLRVRCFPIGKRVKKSCTIVFKRRDFKRYGQS